MISMKQTLLDARKNGRSAFIPFIMAGDPNMETCREIVMALQKSGADVLELGVPFSDPAADGVTVQRAAERSLAQGTTLNSVLELLTQLRRGGVTMPICLFSYLNPVYHMGYETFIKRALQSGANGALLVDLPPEEASDYWKLAKQHQFETVFLCSPTTSPERLKMIDDCSSGFVYFISREGVTGAQSSLSGSLEDTVQKLRATLHNPVAVGFGISQPEHVRQLAGKADGIVVGSYLVKAIEEAPKNITETIMAKVKFLKN